MARTKGTTQTKLQALNEAKIRTVNKACQLCSKHKLKCEFVHGSDACKRCKSSGQSCKPGNPRKTISPRQGLKNGQKALCWIVDQLLTARGSRIPEQLGDLARQFIAKVHEVEYEYTLEDDALEALKSSFANARGDVDTTELDVQLPPIFVQDATVDSLPDFGALQEDNGRKLNSISGDPFRHRVDYTPFESSSIAYRRLDSGPSAAGPSTPSVIATDYDNDYTWDHRSHTPFPPISWDSDASSPLRSDLSFLSPSATNAEAGLHAYGYGSPLSSPLSSSPFLMPRGDTRITRGLIAVDRAPGSSVTSAPWNTQTSTPYANSDAFSTPAAGEAPVEWNSDINSNDEL
ncbi:hypothetical protein EXIGLDRAFT_749949 [Exidia glandulosa HHB12029]|uniref:Zn(2)-C6 fungal-type domain-containing protein n=1 Tax=Exidia glandulosa HHB12029 TaxID=1314781 RepID=A0A165HCW7_EXIGL|nr:hypothetical protein EXIGLDRAFT_749949 [Exidia glandulosa HHB12029]